MQVVNNETTSSTFGGDIQSGYSFVKLGDEYAMKGFYICPKSNTQKTIQRIVEQLFEVDTYKRLLNFAIKETSKKRPDKEAIWTAYFGQEDDNIMMAFCFDKTFHRIDVKITIGDKDSDEKELLMGLKNHIERTAIFEIGKVSDKLKKFFLSFSKSELDTLEKVQDSISLHERLENKLTITDKNTIVELSRRYCMDKREASRAPQRSFLEWLTMKPHKEIYA